MRTKIPTGGAKLYLVTRKHLGSFFRHCRIYLFLKRVFNLLSPHESGRSFVYRVNGTRFMPGHTKIIKKSGRKSVPVWGWFSCDGAGDLYRINGRLTGKQYVKILEDVLLPSAWARFGTDELIPFVQDRSVIHTSTIVMDWFAEEEVSFDVLPWHQREQI